MSILFAGLAKYGLDESLVDDLYEDKKTVVKEKENDFTVKETVAPSELDFLLLKSIRCPICDKTFRTIQTKSGRVKRKESDLDLRPRFEYIDTNKYDVSTCPHCGFTAINRYFGHLSPVQIKLVREGVCSKFKTPPTKEIVELKTYSYDEAIDLYKLALFTTITKKGSNSEKAYICLKIAWLLHGKIEELSLDKEKNKDNILSCQKDYVLFYNQAFEGFTKAMTSENYPMCGMDQNTVDLLIAAIAFNLEKYEYSSRFVSNLIVSRTAGPNIKNRAQDLKEKILKKIKGGNESE